MGDDFITVPGCAAELEEDYQDLLSDRGDDARVVAETECPKKYHLISGFKPRHADTLTL